METSAVNQDGLRVVLAAVDAMNDQLLAAAHDLLAQVDVGAPTDWCSSRHEAASRAAAVHAQRVAELPAVGDLTIQSALNQLRGNLELAAARWAAVSASAKSSRDAQVHLINNLVLGHMYVRNGVGFLGRTPAIASR